MTIDELVARARSEGWQLRAPGYGQDRFFDNVHVVDRDEDGWFLGFLERGETAVMARFDSESEAAQAAHERLLARYRPSPPPSPVTRSTPQGRTSSWTLPKPDRD
jgi:hypothetical protein